MNPAATELLGSPPVARLIGHLLVGRSDDPNPSADVVKIILFSITGAIIAFFFTLVALGSLRVYRHPERYLPPQVTTQPTFSRAKGITLAILHTMPIVNFAQHGESSNRNQDRDRDVELPQSSTEVDDQQSKPFDTIVQPGYASSQDARIETTVFAKDDKICALCMDTFSVGQKVRLLRCDHYFHPDCIDPWLLNMSSTCPLCRIDLDHTSPSETKPEPI
ncbi:hypothetical protein B0A52_03316 [Exophiala mesophila]|uniref:RING-type domain-containing protein n=1 Tax=Exophiala mesophila TaxID=212818 RepID=A0A438NB21_EXOME|nr:hypothetical protein B0A52_03316 [Exophiala mesophila]